MKRPSHALRFISTFLAGILLSQGAFSHLLTLNSIPKPQTSQTLNPSLLKHVQFKNKRVQSDRPLVYLLQDIHLNEEAQRNMARAIEMLGQDKVVVGVEGSYGPFDYAPYKKLPRQDVVKQVADEFLVKGWIQSASYAALTSDLKKARFVGLEDAALYSQNVNAYRDAKKHEAKARKSQARFEAETNAALKTLRADLQKFAHDRGAYHSGKMSLGEYAQYLNDNSINLETFLAAYDLEKKLDFDRVEKEKQHVLERLAGRMDEKEIAVLKEASAAYQAHQITLAVYFRFVQQLIEQQNVPLAQYPAFANYLRYLFLSDGIDVDQIFADLKAAEESELKSLKPTKNELEVLNQQKLVLLTGKLLDFALTPEEWSEYKSHAHARSACEPFEEFYRFAEERNEVLVKNLGDVKTGVMIAGGFHTPGLQALLEKKGYSTVVLTPRVTKLDTAKGSEYLNVFLKEKNPLRKLFAGRKLFLAIPDGIGTVPPQTELPAANVKAAFDDRYTELSDGSAPSTLAWLWKRIFPGSEPHEIIGRWGPHETTFLIFLTFTITGFSGQPWLWPTVFGFSWGFSHLLGTYQRRNGVISYVSWKDKPYRWSLLWQSFRKGLVMAVWLNTGLFLKNHFVDHPLIVSIFVYFSGPLTHMFSNRRWLLKGGPIFKSKVKTFPPLLHSFGRQFHVGQNDNRLIFYIQGLVQAKVHDYGRPGELHDIGFSGDGRRLVTWHNDMGLDEQHIQIWTDLWSLGGPNGQRSMVTNSKTARFTAMALSPTEPHLSVADTNGRVMIYDISKGEYDEEQSFHVGGSDIKSLFYHPSGKLLALINEQGALELWDINLRRKIKGPSDLQVQAPVSFTADGNSVVVHGKSTNFPFDHISKLEIDLKRLIPSHQHIASHEAIEHMVVHPKKNLLAFHPEGKDAILVYNLDTFELTDVVNTPSSEVTFVDFAPNGELVFGLYDERNKNTVYRWELAGVRPPVIKKNPIEYDFGPIKALGDRGVTPQRIHMNAPVTSVIYSPDGKWRVTSSEVLGRLQMDFKYRHGKGKSFVENRHIYYEADGSEIMAFHPDGVRVALAWNNGAIGIYDLSQKKWVAEWIGEEKSPAERMVFSPDGKYFAALINNNVHVWDCQTGSKIRHDQPSNDLIVGLGFSPTSRSVVTADSSSNVQIQPLRSNKSQKVQLPQSMILTHVTGFAVNPNPEARFSWLVGFFTGIVTFFEYDSGRHPHMRILGPATDFVFSRDGRLAASLHRNFHTKKFSIYLWDTEGPEELAILSTELKDISSIAMSPDGTELTASSRDGSLLVWDIPFERNGKPKSFWTTKVTVLGILTAIVVVAGLWHFLWQILPLLIIGMAMNKMPDEEPARQPEPFDPSVGLDNGFQGALKIVHEIKERKTDVVLVVATEAPLVTAYLQSAWVRLFGDLKFPVIKWLRPEQLVEISDELKNSKLMVVELTQHDSTQLIDYLVEQGCKDVTLSFLLGARLWEDPADKRLVGEINEAAARTLELMGSMLQYVDFNDEDETFFHFHLLSEMIHNRYMNATVPPIVKEEAFIETGEELPELLQKRGYKLIRNFSRGGSSSQTYLAQDPAGRRVVVKYSDWDGISGNGTPWLVRQVEKLNYIQEHYPLAARPLYPKVLDFYHEGQVAYSAMEYFEGAMDITKYYFYDPFITEEDVYRSVNSFVSLMAQTHYSHRMEKYADEFETNILGRLKYRVGLLSKHDGEIYSHLIAGRPFKVGSVEYPDSSYFFEDLVKTRFVEINGRVYPNLPQMIAILDEKREQIKSELGPTHYADFSHGDIPMRNVLRVPDGTVRIIDVRGQNIHPTSPSKTSVEYDLSKIAHGFFLEMVRNGYYHLEAQRSGGLFSFYHWFFGYPGNERFAHMREHFYSLLAENRDIVALFPSDSEWLAQVKFGEYINYASDAIHRFSQDPTGEHPLLYYLEAVQGIYAFLQERQLLPDGIFNSSLNGAPLASGQADIVEYLARELTRTPATTRVAVSGASNSGKTYTTKALKKRIEDSGRKVAVVSLDWFLRNRDVRKLIIDAVAAGKIPLSLYQRLAWDMNRYQVFLEEFNAFLAEGNTGTFSYEIKDAYSRETGKNDQKMVIEIEPGSVVLFEGVSSVDEDTLRYFEQTILIDNENEQSIIQASLNREREKAPENQLSEDVVVRRLRAVDLPRAAHFRFFQSSLFNFKIDNTRHDHPLLFKMTAPSVAVLSLLILMISGLEIREMAMMITMAVMGVTVIRTASGLAPEVEETRRLLGEIVRKPPDFNWAREKNSLPTLTGRTLGEINSAGEIAFSPVPHYRYRWNPLGRVMPGWRGDIVATSFNKSVFELTVRFTKEGHPPLERTYQIGAATRSIAGHRTQKGHTIQLLEISEKLGTSALAHVLTAPEHSFPNLAGMRLGETSVGGRIDFSVTPNFIYRWHPLGFPEKGWAGEIISSGKKKNNFQFSVRFTKDGRPPIEHTYEIGLKMRPVFGRRAQAGETYEVRRIRRVRPMEDESLSGSRARTIYRMGDFIWLPSRGEAPWQQAARRELGRDIRKAVKSLSGIQRRIARWVIEGWPDEQIEMRLFATPRLVYEVRLSLQHSLRKHLDLPLERSGQVRLSTFVIIVALLIFSGGMLAFLIPLISVVVSWRSKPSLPDNSFPTPKLGLGDLGEHAYIQNKPAKEFAHKLNIVEARSNKETATKVQADLMKDRREALITVSAPDGVEIDLAQTIGNAFQGTTLPPDFKLALKQKRIDIRLHAKTSDWTSSPTILVDDVEVDVATLFIRIFGAIKNIGRFLENLLNSHREAQKAA